MPDENLLPQRNKENFFGLSKLGLARNQSIEETQLQETQKMRKTQTSFIGKKSQYQKLGKQRSITVPQKLIAVWDHEDKCYILWILDVCSE